MKKFFIVIVIMLFVTGCYDYRELNDMSVVDGIAIDYKDDKYEVKLEVVSSEKGKDGNEIKTNVISSKDKVLANAFYKATKKSSGDIYLGHVSLLVVSENVAKRGLNDVIDYVLRDIRISNDYSILVTDNIDLFKIDSKNESISQKVNKIANVSLGINNNVTVDMVGSMLVNDRIDLVIPYLEIDKDKTLISKIVYFKEDKMDGIIDDKIYNFLMLDNLDINFNKDNNVVNVYDKDIKYEVKNNMVIINIDCYGTIMNLDKKYDLSKKDTYGKIENMIESVIKKDINKFMKDHKDLIGINDMYYKKYNKVKDIDSYSINVNLNINKNGAIYEVLDD